MQHVLQDSKTLSSSFEKLLMAQGKWYSKPHTNIKRELLRSLSCQSLFDDQSNHYKYLPMMEEGVNGEISFKNNEALDETKNIAISNEKSSNYGKLKTKRYFVNFHSVSHMLLHLIAISCIILYFPGTSNAYANSGNIFFC